MSSLAQRRTLLALVARARSGGARQTRVCKVVGVSARTLERWRAAPARGVRRPATAQIVPRLADRGEYLASESTLYRLLRQAEQLQPRGHAHPRTPRHKPRALSANAPNQLYSWDITYLPAAVRGQYYYLYLFLDLFSRKIVGAQAFDTEDSERAAELMHDICRREGIAPVSVFANMEPGDFRHKGASGFPP